MLKKVTKFTVLVFILIGILAICSRVYLSKLNLISPESSRNFEQAPIRRIWITLDQNQHDQLFDQLRKFADQHAFTIQISQTDPTGENFLVQMWREDIKFIAVDSGDPRLFKIGFYNASEEHPVDIEVVDELIIDLKEYIEEIPNSTFILKE